MKDPQIDTPGSVVFVDMIMADKDILCVGVKA